MTRKTRNKRGRSDRAAEVQYHGLTNQGATCYLNSVLQVLFMTPRFREAVESVSDDSRYIDPQLRAVFQELKVSTSNALEILRKLGVDKENKQQDAAEYYEKMLTLSSPEVSKVFRGKLAHRTTCEGCQTHTGEEGHFWNLALDLQESNYRPCSVVESLEKYVEPSFFSGENQMFCQRCDAKHDAKTERVITHHPEVLTLLLKRFLFDPHVMKHVKSESDVDVPLFLTVAQMQYELYAVVEHVGSLKSGHYTAMIQSQENRTWYRFNDASVRPLPQEPFQKEQSWKSCAAFLLFYRRKSEEPEGALSTGVAKDAYVKPRFPPPDKDQGGRKSRGHSSENQEDKGDKRDRSPIKRAEVQEARGRSRTIDVYHQDVRGAHGPKATKHKSKSGGEGSSNRVCPEHQPEHSRGYSEKPQFLDLDRFDQNRSRWRSERTTKAPRPEPPLTRSLSAGRTRPPQSHRVSRDEDVTLWKSPPTARSEPRELKGASDGRDHSSSEPLRVKGASDERDRSSSEPRRVKGASDGRDHRSSEPRRVKGASDGRDHRSSEPQRIRRASDGRDYRSSEPQRVKGTSDGRDHSSSEPQRVKGASIGIDHSSSEPQRVKRASIGRDHSSSEPQRVKRASIGIDHSSSEPQRVKRASDWSNDAAEKPGSAKRRHMEGEDDVDALSEDFGNLGINDPPDGTVAKRKRPVSSVSCFSWFTKNPCLRFFWRKKKRTINPSAKD